MITVREAKKLIAGNAITGKQQVRFLQDTIGLTLAEDIYAQYDIPAFPQSSMDGYAFRFDDLQEFDALTIVDESAAGNTKTVSIGKGEAVRIFTGAPLPEGADTVVMQEKVRLEQGILFVEDERLVAGMHMRNAGSEIKAGMLAMEKGQKIVPAVLGFLAGIGVEQLVVYPPPRIHIIVTGNELQAPGQLLQPGHVYESNSFSLRAALLQMGVTDVRIAHVTDQLDFVINEINKASIDADIILLTGGVSVGDYDFVPEATKTLGVEKIFHKIKQRPGKPLYFGRENDTLVFGLPGNPASVLTCFYEYVSLAIDGFMKNAEPSLKTVEAKLATAFSKPAGLTHFLKARYKDGIVKLLDAQESYRMSSYAKANCLLVAGEERTNFEAGEMVEVHIIPS
ncbi:gephyrin-like molybdotransferase Glp [Pollutibacter soli]|uniref:molybdopterin molybdotransferase MoeA n=1 Tax=Pollutibacter soli TaxID=3034157 RepID=UPI003013BE16